MKKLFIAVLFLFPVVLLAQVPSPSPAPVPSASFLSPSIAGLIVSLVLCLNIVLSAVQKVFAQLSKSEPGWLQAVSGAVLKVVQFLGSNPSL